MNFKILFLSSLMVALISQPLWAMVAEAGTEDILDSPRLRLARKVESFIWRADTVSTLAETQDSERRSTYLNLTLKELDDALKLLKNNLALRDVDDKFLVARIYFSQGQVFENASD